MMYSFMKCEGALMVTTARTQPRRGRRGKWVVVRDDLLRRFADAEPGTQVPTESELCDEYDVSRATIRHAVQQLVNDGVLIRQQGRGTYRAGPTGAPGPRQELLNLTGFHAQMTAEGRRVESRVLANGIFRAPLHVARELGLPEHAPMVRLDRLRSVDGTIDHLNRTWMDTARVPGMEQVDFSTTSLYTYLRLEHHIRLVQDHVTAGLYIPTGDEADLLQIPADRTILKTSSTAYDTDGRPLAHAHTLFASTDASVRFITHAGDRTPNQPAPQMKESHAPLAD